MPRRNIVHSPCAVLDGGAAVFGELFGGLVRILGMGELAAGQALERRIFIIRGIKVMIDRDLAELYGVYTFALNQAVKRNADRFPEGFMFRLNRQETRELITNCDHLRALKFSHQTPLAFTEYGIAMLSSVLRGKRAVQANVRIIQTFIRLREWALTHKDLAAKISELESRVKSHDRQIESVFRAIRELIAPPDKSRRVAGFHP